MRNIRLAEKNYPLTLFDIRKVFSKEFVVLDIIPNSVEVIHSATTHSNFTIIDTDMIDSVNLPRIAEALGFNSRIILLSSKPEQGYHFRYDYILEKPFTGRELLQAVRLMDNLKEKNSNSLLSFTF